MPYTSQQLVVFRKTGINGKALGTSVIVQPVPLDFVILAWTIKPTVTGAWFNPVTNIGYTPSSYGDIFADIEFNLVYQAGQVAQGESNATATTLFVPAGSDLRLNVTTISDSTTYVFDIDIVGFYLL